MQCSFSSSEVKCVFLHWFIFKSSRAWSEMKRDRGVCGMLFWVYICISRWEESQQNIFHVLCSFALLKHLRVISLHKSIWRERSLNPLDLVLLLFQGIFLIGNLSFMVLIGSLKAGASPELLWKNAQSCELWLEGFLMGVYILHCLVFTDFLFVCLFYFPFYRMISNNSSTLSVVEQVVERKVNCGGMMVLASAEVQQHLLSALLRFLRRKFRAVVPSVWIFCSNKQRGQPAGALLITIYWRNDTLEGEYFPKAFVM